MTKRNLFTLIPLTLIAGSLVYSWVVFFTTPYGATWRQYVALALFVAPCLLFFVDYKKAVIDTLIYLLSGVFNVLSMQSTVTVFTINFFGYDNPVYINLLSLVLLILAFCLNFNTLVNMYLDFKEKKDKKI